MAATALTGLAVRLLDDFLDEPELPSGWLAPLVARAGRGVIAYALLFLALGAACNLEWTVTLFLSAYAIGMGHEGQRLLPSGLAAWGECALALAVGVVRFGLLSLAASFTAVLFVQLLDDLVDVEEDKERGRSNWALRWGSVESALVAVLAALLSWELCWQRFLLVAGAGLVLAHRGR
ncbi:MAG: hypothetical protein QJR13_01080 [Bacillota bacterium]|nr:hypothetical protein [Bacillota bacterium]